MANSFRFENFQFDPESGDLLKLAGLSVEKVARLQPQPAKLLTLLLSRFPDVVSHEEIKSFVWPEVQVDLEGSLHFCIRQIRAALNDSASDPKYIENIPRRGYRWIPKVTKENVVGSEDDASNTKGYSVRKSILVVGFILLVAVLFYFITSPLAESESSVISSRVLKVAVMPFQPTDSSDVFFGNDIAFRLVDDLTNQYPQLGIIGPTTTVNINPDQVRATANDLELDYIINARFLKDSVGSTLLGEIIRVKDGVHIWVRRFFPTDPSDSIVATIENGVIEKLLTGQAK